MTTHPVQLHIERTDRVPRVQVAIRLVLVLALGVVSWAGIYWLLYLALPALVASRISHKGGDFYVRNDAPRLVRALRWLAGAYAYLCYLTDVLPTSQGGPIDLQIDISSQPTTGSALLRLATSLPALVLVALLSIVGGLAWLAAAACALVTERVPHGLAALLAAVVRTRFRLVAYHLSLVDRYPSLREPALEHAPGV